MSSDQLARRHPVLELIRRRRGSGSLPGQRAAGDTARLGLLIQGGAMRGVISAAMLCALDDLGCKDTFDVVFGCSAGATNAAYFLAGETWYPLSIYYDDLASDRFVDFLRPLRRRPMLNLEYAFDEVIRCRKPLATEAVISSRIDLRIAVTVLDPPAPLVVSSFASGDDLIDALRGSCWLPIATSGSALFRGARAIDGGVLMPSMDGAAVQDGCTHILSLRTQPADQTTRYSRIGVGYVKARLNRLSAGLGDAYEQALREDPRQRADRSAVHHKLEVAPPPGGRLSRYETNGFKLLSAARIAYGAMFAAVEDRSQQDLENGSLQIIPRLTAITPIGHRGAMNESARR